MPQGKEETYQTTADIQAELETKSAEELNAILTSEDGSDPGTDAAGSGITGEGQAGDESAEKGAEETQKADTEGETKEDDAASKTEGTGDDLVVKLNRRVEEKEKIIGRQGTELGQLRPLKTLLDKFSENPRVAIEYFQRLEKEKYGDKPPDAFDIADEDLEAVQTALLSDDKTALKGAFSKLFDKALSRQKSQEDIARTQREVEKAQQAAAVSEAKSFLTSLNPDHDKPEMVELIKEVMVENGVKAENVETALAKFYLLPLAYTAAWVTEAKARHQINAIKAEAEQTKNKAAGIFDKINKTSRTMKGVTAASGQAVAKATPKKPSFEEMQTWPKEELEKYLNEKEE